MLKTLAEHAALPPTLILTTFDDADVVLDGIRAGARREHDEYDDRPRERRKVSEVQGTFVGDSASFFSRQSPQEKARGQTHPLAPAAG